MSNQDSQLKTFEQRLLRIEKQLGLEPLATSSVPTAPNVQTKATPSTVTISPSTTSQPPITPPAKPVKNQPDTIITAEIAPALAPWQPRSSRPVHMDQGSSALATSLMAIGGAISFLLAAAYFIGLVYAAGWLTPPRQIGIAAVAGMSFIIAGILFSQHERRYSAYLPAVGVAILFLASFAAYSMYELISFPVMMVTVAIISLIAIAIDRYFNQAIYSMMAAVMVYMTPLFAGGDANLYTTVVYYTAWGLLFSFMSLQLGRRLIYLIAMYMAILSFDASWRFSGQPEWQLAFVFQFAQFMIFAATAAAFSFVHKRGMTEGESAAHGLPLFFFYITQFFLLKIHAPNFVEIFGLACVAIVVGLYFFGRNRLSDKTNSNATALVSLFASSVVAHVIFLEFMPIELLPWTVLAVPVIVLALRSQMDLNQAAMIPVMIVTAIMMCSGLVLAFAPEGLLEQTIIGAKFVLFAYSAILYVCYWMFVHDTRVTNLSPGILYAGHIAFLIGVIRLTDNQLFVSMIWAALAVTLLVIAIKFGDRILGQSSLLIFIASAIKVVMFDLAGTPGPIRVLILIVLGASLYAGGWLYQNLVRQTQVFHSNRAINDQLRAINTLVQQGLTSPQIHEKLIADKTDCLAEGGWSVELIDRIRGDYQMV